MIAGDTDGQDRGLINEVGVHLLTSEAGLGCVQRGVEQADAGAFGQDDMVYPGDRLSNDQGFGEAQVPHCARRSRISLSRSVTLRR